jgi:hypothetical protein
MKLKWIVQHINKKNEKLGEPNIEETELSPEGYGTACSDPMIKSVDVKPMFRPNGNFPIGVEVFITMDVT